MNSLMSHAQHYHNVTDSNEYLANRHIIFKYLESTDHQLQIMKYSSKLINFQKTYKKKVGYLPKQWVLCNTAFSCYGTLVIISEALLHSVQSTMNVKCLHKYSKQTTFFLNRNPSSNKHEACTTKSNECIAPTVDGKRSSLLICVSTHSINFSMYSVAGSFVGFL